ncbi:MAG: adenine phosphoribosyltransferase [Acidobacteria bacterium]|nr:adenine phosphoribosyltransferase [Acidobacteriota bacterium]
MDHLKKLIREVPDFPKPGILFYDITTLLKDPKGFQELTNAMVDRFREDPPDVVLGVEARGFIFAPLLASKLEKGFVPVRKPGKLPAKTSQVSYALEYGNDTLQIHSDAVEPGQKVLIVDDLLATGGTAKATCQLVEELGGKVHGLAFVVELSFLPGRKALDGYDVFSLLTYDE